MRPISEIVPHRPVHGETADSTGTPVYWRIDGDCLAVHRHGADGWTLIPIEALAVALGLPPRGA